MYLPLSVMDNRVSLRFLLLALFLTSSSPSSTFHSNLRKGSSLLVEDYSNQVLVSENGVFAAGFFQVGENAFCFSIWFIDTSTVVWMANRDKPVNGRRSKLSLLKTGSLILTDADQLTVWATNPFSNSVELQLHDNGNLILYSFKNDILWQSFDFPTDTLLPQQKFTQRTQLVSKRSQSNYSSGFYKLYFENNNVLSLQYNGPERSSVYWPDPTLLPWNAGRAVLISSKVAEFDSLGYFNSTDGLNFNTTDYGVDTHRRLTVDIDGNLRLYSINKLSKSWVISWQAFAEPCTVHGLCGENSFCYYDPSSGMGCQCLPGFKLKDRTDWSLGCEPNVSFACDESDVGFVEVIGIEYYGIDIEYVANSTTENCKAKCLENCKCKGFNYNFDYDKGYYGCFQKAVLVNGKRFAALVGKSYVKVKLPANGTLQTAVNRNLLCSNNNSILLNRTYTKAKESGSVLFLFRFAIAVGGVEILCIFCVWLFLFRNKEDVNVNVVNQGYLLATIGFRRYTYKELKQVTDNFREEIGRGGSVVYKGKLPDGQIVAIKRLNEANQGEDEFLAEVTILGKLNHMNLIELWGYCAEGKHRLLVYEYMEHGSLAEKLLSNEIDWKMIFEIALGMAKGLAYLHEECLEWVLHCDVKPQNILLDSNFQPKVADFGLSKLLNRGDGDTLNFSMIRGTRGYMAPEWILNVPITSKVDVYSFGVVVLEMVTGKSPVGGAVASSGGDEAEPRGLVMWVREVMTRDVVTEIKMREIVNPYIDGEHDWRKMEILLEVALRCVEDDKEARPTMRQVVEMLSQDGN